eukprot:TRINITY_DN94666_c0_g1_i1.p1 TRINITY_DN94666_c0_g1~~TRINITY_DN94666_c0_g1_i1.p1  ORF type:complete len:180 (+),score=43.20 TRINITY_DN94666_c0_g1_i1:23-562(+)
MAGHMDALAGLSDSNGSEEEEADAKEEEKTETQEALQPAAKKTKTGFGNDYFRALMNGGPELSQTADTAEKDSAGDAEEAVAATAALGYSDLLKAGLRKDELKGKGKAKGKKGRGRAPPKILSNTKESWNWGRGDGELGVLPRSEGGRGRGRGAGGDAENHEGDEDAPKPRRPRAGLGS